MLLTITTTGKVTLLIVAGLFIAWALITAIWIPKRNPDFPATLTVFLLVSSLFLVAQLGAVYWVTSTQEVETEAAETARREHDAGRDDTAETIRETHSRAPTPTSSRARRCSSPPAAWGATPSPMPARPGRVGPNLDEAKPPAEPRRHPRHERAWARCRRSRGS